MKDNLFVNKFDKEFRNNEKVFYSNGNNVDRIPRKIDVRKEINEIFKSNDFVYKADVKITLKEKVRMFNYGLLTIIFQLWI